MSDHDFEDVKILNNFYQTSSFFPMPVVLVGTVSESGQTNLGPYSLIFPLRIAGEGRRAMVLVSRWDSNTAKNIRRTGVCSINFIPDDKKYLKNCVELGFPGETTEEKMKNSIFTLLPSQRNEEDRMPNVIYPEIVKESIQVFECSVCPNEPIITDEKVGECRMVLLVDKIIMKKKWKEALIKGEGFPPIPVDFGFRNNVNFWFAKIDKPYKEPIPESKAVDINSIRYAVDRCADNIEWTDDACAKIVKVPRIFLTTVIKSINDAAKKEGRVVVDGEFMDKVRDKRSSEKK